jgi:uncharacterized protein YjbI with pentapeptide repeats
MDYKELLPHFTKSKVEKATESLYEYGDNRACSNNRIFNKAIKATYYNDNYSYMSLKRTFLKECTIVKSDFSGAAVTGSKFIQTLFNNCVISGTNFQCCDFIESKFQDFYSKIETSNFSNSTFINSEFINVNFRMNTIFQSLFESCKFTDCIIDTSTLEGSIFRDCIFDHVDLSNLNIDYVILCNPIMNEVVLPFFQVPYIINGFSFLETTNDTIWIDSEKSPNGKISIEEYLQLTNEMIIYFYGLKEFFPLANIYLAKGDVKTALACIMEGIERNSRQNDFRMIKHFCRLATSTPQFTTRDIKEIYHLLETRFEPETLTSRELHGYLSNIGEIRTILFNGNYNLQTLEMIIQTNIDSTEARKLSVFLEKLNKLLDDNNQNGRSQFVELRHNSDYTIFISCVNTFEQLMPILLSLYSVFGLVDKGMKFYNTFLDNKIKRESIRNAKNSISKEDVQIKRLEMQLKDLKSDKNKMISENKLLTTNNLELINCINKMIEENKILAENVSELTHYIKGATNQDAMSGMLYSKSVLENQKNIMMKDALGEN